MDFKKDQTGDKILKLTFNLVVNKDTHDVWCTVLVKESGEDVWLKKVWLGEVTISKDNPYKHTIIYKNHHIVYDPLMDVIIEVYESRKIRLFKVYHYSAYSDDKKLHYCHKCSKETIFDNPLVRELGKQIIIWYLTEKCPLVKKLKRTIK